MATDHAARRAVVSASKLFRALREPEIDALLARAATRRYERNAAMLRQGDASEGAMVILSGRVRIGATAEDGREIGLAVLGPGEVLGEMSMLDGAEVSADATAIEECVVLAIERARFMRMLRDDSELCLRMMAVLCDRLRRSNSALEDMALLDLPTRLGRLLLNLARECGQLVPGGVRIELRLSQRDLSTLVGGSREKVNRVLRGWEEDGVLARELGRVVIRRPDGLLPV